MKRWICLARLGLAAVLAGGVLLTSAPSRADDYAFINIATASTAGSYYPSGLAIAKLINDHLDRRASAQSSAGSVENVDLLRNGEANMAIIQNNVVRDALAGTGIFEGNAFEGMRVLTPLFTNSDHVVVRTAAGIDSLAAIAGKRWAVGSVGSGTLLSNQAILGGAGLTVADVQAEYIGQTEAMAALQNGLIDGANLTSGVPFAQLQELLLTAGDSLTIYGMTEAEQAAVVETSGWKAPFLIPAGTYQGQTDTLNTVSHLALIMVPTDYPEDLAYALLRLMEANVDTLKQAHGAFRSFDLASAEARVTAVNLPIHPGAQRFFDGL